MQHSSAAGTEQFQELLYAVHMIQAAQHPNPELDLGQVVGELDWHREIVRIAKEIKETTCGF